MAEIVIAIPHAGVALPDDLAPTPLPHVTPEFLRTQSDAFTDRVYSLPGVRTVKYPWSRFVADPNRSPRQTTEGGVVPVTDFAEQPMYPPGGKPTQEQREERIEKYHRPYHAELTRAVNDPRTRFFIDGHSMCGTPPVRSPDHGLQRPDAVISNLGDSHGYPAPGAPYLTCPTPLTQWLTDRLSHWMLAIHAPDAGARAAVRGSVWINNPFLGGYGVRNHASLSHDRPGVQLELNQRLWTDEELWVPLERRIPWMREVLRRWCEEIVDRIKIEPKFASRAG
ncbi:MAG: hypothetical protein GY898_10045 [Proteobacteria bacterium]|nr:hypothetical protein [Pseudomonadota bacterium]